LITLQRLYDRAVAGPEYPPNAADLADLRLFGLAFPRRAAVAILAVTALIVADQTGLLMPGGPVGAEGLSGIVGPVPLTRFLLFLVVPVAIVLLGFRDDPRRYGLRLGDWRWGAGLLIAGLLVMTPIILALAQLESFRLYYGTSGTAPESLAIRIVNNVTELLSAEFLLRGFLMFALWRRIGPLALVVSLVPFVLTHIGKPDVELWSTFVGGSIFAWLDWRTGSILWSALGHVFVLTLMTAAVGGVAFGGAPIGG
jgi:membrane protease YdiL (CAAX protease family)